MRPWWRPCIDGDALTENLNGLRELLGLHECHRCRDHAEVMRTLRDTNTKLDTLLGIVTQQRQEERQMAADISGIVDAIAAERTVVDSTKQLVAQTVALEQQQTAKIQELINAAGAGGVDPAALQAVVDASNANRSDLLAANQQLADALVANTPAAPAAP